MSLIEDARAILERDPAAKSLAQVIFLYPGFKVLFYHRIAHRLYINKHYYLARWISQRARKKTGIEIHPGAKIGKRLFIDHGMGIVIGETAEIGDDCTIYHGVTLGGTGKDVGKRHPTIGNKVLIGAGATVLGPFKVGDNSMIGAQTLVLDEVEDNCTIVGTRGRIVKKNNTKICPSYSLDQIHTPDPLAQEICRLMTKIESLEKEIDKLKEEKEIETL